MIPASHKGWAHAIFRRYLHFLIKKRFHALHVLGDMPQISADTPVLLLPNHSTWWDGFFPYVLNDIVFKREFFIMMLEHRLREFWFFRFVGAFSINQQSPKGIAQSLDYTTTLLQGNRLVVLFPQGELSAWGKRPLGYNRGVERVIRKCLERDKQIAIIPLAMRCEFFADEKPHVFLLCGAPLFMDATAPASTADELERLETALLEELERRTTAGEVGEILL